MINRVPAVRDDEGAGVGSFPGRPIRGSDGTHGGSAGGLLVVIGSNPPSTTSGARTLGRVEQAKSILGFREARLVNLFAYPTYRSGGVSTSGAAVEGWLEARVMLAEELPRADGALLAHGTQSPTGRARDHYRAQVSWLDGLIIELDLPSWWVGGAPRHPSRWQRYTHRQYSEASFGEALSLALTQRPAVLATPITDAARASTS